MVSYSRRPEFPRRRPAGLLCLLVAGLCGAATAAAAPPEPDLLLGVLEEVPGGAPDQGTIAQIRVIFRHATTGWSAFPNACDAADCPASTPPDAVALKLLAAEYPRSVRWSVSLAGLSLGSIRGRTPPVFPSYAQVGVQDIVSHGTVPAVGGRTLDYAGSVDRPVHRPLLVTSGARRPLRSAAGWKEGVPDPEDLERVWTTFRRQVPLIDDCSPDTAAGVHGADGPAAGRRPRKLELEIPAVWVARSGDALLKVIVREEVYRECDGPRTLPSQLWVYREAGGRVRALPGQLQADHAALVAPLDFVDLLHDGHEQAVFFAASHDRGGYVLYYDHFRKFLKFFWPYHGDRAASTGATTTAVP